MIWKIIPRELNLLHLREINSKNNIFLQNNKKAVDIFTIRLYYKRISYEIVKEGIGLVGDQIELYGGIS